MTPEQIALVQNSFAKVAPYCPGRSQAFLRPII